MPDVSHFNIKISVDSKTGEAKIQNLGKVSKETSEKMKSSFSGAKLAMAGLVAGALFAAKDMVKAFTVQRDAVRDLEATLRSTAGASGMTSAELQNMAAELQKVTNFGDEATLKGQAMLLTFTNIGKDVFPQATEAMLNMAQKFGGGPEGLATASVQLGKALNDPIQGVTALRRVGVQLSAEQEKQIQKFMELGDTASAQKVILGELETEFGGLARSMADPVKQMNNLFGDMKEQFGAIIMEVVTPLMPLVGEIIGVLMDVAKTLAPVLKQLGDALVPIIQALLPPLRELLNKIFKALAPVFDVVAKLLVKMAPLFGKLATAAGKVVEAAAPMLEVFAELAEEQMDMLVELVTVLLDLFVALSPAIIIASKATAEIMKAGLSFMNLVVTPLIDGIKWIIEQGAKAANVVASIFGGGGGKKKKSGGGGSAGTESSPLTVGQLSPDGKMMWNGTAWVPVKEKNTGGGGGKGKESLVPGSAPYMEEQIKKVEALRDKTVQGSEAWAKYALQLAAMNAEMDLYKRIAEDLTGRGPAAKGASPFEQIASDIALIPEAAKPAIDATVQLLDVLAAAYEEMGSVLTSVMDSLGTLFNANFEEMKYISIAQAIVNTATGVTKALAQGGFLGWAGAAAVGLAGAAQIKTIMNAKPGGGGSSPISGLAQSGSAARTMQTPRRLSLSGSSGSDMPKEIRLVADGDSLVGVLQVNTRRLERAGV